MGGGEWRSLAVAGLFYTHPVARTVCHLCARWALEKKVFSPLDDTARIKTDRIKSLKTIFSDFDAILPDSVHTWKEISVLNEL